MITLMFKKQASRSLPVLLVKGLLLATVYLGIYNLAALRHGGDLFDVQLLFVWLNLAVYLTLGNIRNRCGRFELALPVSTRRLWLAHLATVFIASILMLAMTCGVMIVGISLLSRLPSAPAGVGGRRLLDAFPQLFAVLVLSLAVLLSRDLSLYRIPRSGRNRLVLALVIVGGLLLILLLGRLSSWFSLLPLAAGLAVLGYSYRRLPETFSVAPSRPVDDGAPEERRQPGGRLETAADIRTGPTAEYRRAYLKTIFKVTTSVQGFVNVPGVIYPYAAMLVIWGVLLSGYFKALKGWSENLRFTFIVLTAYLLFAALKGQMARLHLLDHLPISRRTLFNFLMLPFLGLMAVGYGAGIVATGRLGEKKPDVQYVECNGGYCLFVPYEFCRIAWDGRPRTVDAPWGESYPAWRRSFFKYGGPAIYTPYDTPQGCSADFTALQISRAVEAIYRRHIPPAEIKDRYLETRGDQLFGPKAGGLTLLEDYPGLRRRSDGPLFPVIFLLIGLVWQSMVYLYVRFYRAEVGETKRTIVFIGVMLAAFALHLLQYILAMAGLLHLGAVSSFFVIIIRDFSDSVPGGAFIIWVVCIILFAGAYRLVQRRFEYIEIPVSRSGREI